MRLCLLIYIIEQFLLSTCQDHQWIKPHIVKKASHSLHIILSAFGREFILDLEPNYFLSSTYHEDVSKNNTYNAKDDLYKGWCHYRGNVLNADSSLAAISYCDYKLNGMFEVDGIFYHVQQTNRDDSVKIFTNAENNYRCGYEEKLDHVSSKQSTRIRRQTSDDMHLLNITRYVELVIVNDFKVFTKYGRKTEAIFERSKQIVNIVNSLYSPFNVLVALVGVVIWSEKDEIEITSDSSKTLNNFLKYRRDVLINMYSNDNAQLITGTSFESGIVGKALKQTLCTYEYSGGVNSDYSESVSLVATTIAHELGHNFGMEHDTNNCECPGKNCIMGPSSSFPSPRHWSSCSVKQVLESFKHGIDHCLYNKPSTLFRASCGNGFVDDGEECDCGLPETCNNPCCNATTCKLVKGAECANGDCCDRKTCKIMSHDSKHICRSAKSVCDIAEHCDGASHECPVDRVVKDGTECNPGYAYCYAGRCDAREHQCKLLWGSSGEVADYRCYQHNLNASTSGNCGYNKLKKKYINCELAKDIICGRLHCTTRVEKLEYGPEGAAIISKSMEFRKGKMIYCYSAMIDLGLYEHDPGLVPNGAKCGMNSMCVDQKCVPINKYVMNKPCPYNCNSNGYCDNDGECHCFDGSNSSDCSGYYGRYFFTISIYIIFLLVLPLLILSIYLFYNKHRRIKDWFGKKSQEYNNQKRKKLPMNLEISFPLENVPNVQQVTTFHSANPNDCTPGTAILKPIRPAPPPPKPMLQNGINKQVSNQVSSFEPPSIASDLSGAEQGTSKRTSIRRPKKPPPQPPLPPVCDSGADSDPGVKNLIRKFEHR